MSRARHARKLSNKAVGLVFGGCAASLAAFTYFYVRSVSGQVRLPLPLRPGQLPLLPVAPTTSHGHQQPQCGI